MASLGSFSVEVLANIAQFQSDLGKAQAIADRRARELQRTFQNAGRMIGGALATVGVALSGRALGDWVKDAIDAADRANDLSIRLGVTTEQLSRLSVGAKLSGTSIEALQGGIGKLVKAQADAARGSKEQADLFQALGVSVKDVEGNLRGSDEMLRELADRFQELGDGPERTALALKLFGRAGAELIPLLAEGSKGLAEFDELADRLGVTISKDTALAAAEFNDNLDKLQLASQGLAMQVAEELLPGLIELTESFVDIVADGSLARDIVEGVGEAAEAAGFAFEFATGLASDFIDKMEWIIQHGAEAAKYLAMNNPAMRAGMAIGNAHLAARADWGTAGAIGGDMSRLGAGLDPSARRQNLVGALSPEQQAAAQEAAVAATLELTDAYEKQGGALSALQQRLREYLQKQQDGAAVDRAARERQKELERAAKELAQAYEDIDQALADQRASLSPLHAIWVQYETDLAEAAKRAEEMEAAGVKLAQVNEFLAASIATITARRDEDLRSANAQLQQRQREADVVGRLRDSYREQIRLLGMSAEKRRVEEEVLRAVAEAQEHLIGLTEEEREAKIALIRQTVELGEAQLEVARKAADAQEQTLRSWQDLLDGIGQALGDAIFEGGEAGLDSLKNAFENWARNLTQQRLVIPIQAAFQQGAANGGGISGGLQGVMGGFQNNFGNGTGFRNAGGGMNYGNMGQFASGVYGVYDTWRNGEGGGDGALAGAAAGAQAGMVFGPWGAAIGAIIGALAGYFGGGEPTIRVSDRENDATARSHLDDLIGVARDRFPEGTATRFAEAIAAFDNQIADILDNYSGGGEQLERVREALAQWSIRVEGDAATIENVLEERFADIMATFTEDVRAFVEEGIGLEEQVNRLAQVLIWPDQIQGVLEQFRELELLAGMNQLEQATYGINQQFDELRQQFEDMHASTEELAELERFRQLALADLNGTLEQGVIVTDDAARSYAEFVAQFSGGSEFSSALHELEAQFAANTEQANELARAAGLQAARAEDLALIEADYMRQRERAIADLLASVVEQAGELGYIVTAAALEAQITAINDEIAGLADMRSEGTFGLVMAMQREAQLTEQRAEVEAQLEARRASEEALRRQTGAFDLAQDLADLSLARGVTFEQLASELGLNLDLFGADLGLTAEGLQELIATLEADSLTAGVFGEGVQAIVDAIRNETTKNPFDPNPPGNIDPPRDPDGSKTLELSGEIKTLRTQLLTVQQDGIAIAQAQFEELRRMATYLQKLGLDPNRPRSTREKVTR